MDSIVEENGNSAIDPLADAVPVSQQSSTSDRNSSTATGNTVLTTAPNIVQFIPAQSIQAQSVIQANQSSVIQTAANVHPLTLPKGGVLYVNKQNVSTVIHTAGGNTLQLQIKPEPNTQSNVFDTNSEESLTDEDSPKRRKEFTRRPSYHKILKEISGPDIAGTTLQIANMNSGESGGLHSAITSSGTGTGTIFQLNQETPFYLPGKNI